MKTIIAIDLGKYTSVACYDDTATGGHRFESWTTDGGYFRAVLSAARPDRVVFETCSAAGWVSDLCNELGLAASVADPNHEPWRWRKVKRKADQDDALKLARLAARGELPAVHVPPPAVRQWRTLIKARQQLVERRVAIQNHLRAILQQQGLPMPRGARAWAKAALDALRRQARPLSECGPDERWRGLLHLECRALDQVLALLREAEQALDRLGAADEQVQRLQTIPGVGPRCAEVVVAYLDDPARFGSGRQVSAYAGMVPKQFQSGESDRRGAITRRGPKRLRRMLVEVSWCLLRYNPWARQVFDRLTRGQKTRRKQAVVALGRQLLVRCWAMMRDRTDWRGPETAELTA